MALTQIRDITLTQKEPENKYNLWLHFNDRKKLVLEIFINGEWQEIGYDNYLVSANNPDDVQSFLSTVFSAGEDVTTVTIDGDIDSTVYHAEGTYDALAGNITLLRDGWMYVFSIDQETYEVSISNKVNLNDEDLYFIVGDTEEIKAHNVNEYKKVKRESALVRPTYQARTFRLKYSDGMILQGIGDVPTETHNMYLEVAAYSIKLGMKVFKMYSDGTIIEAPNEFANNIDTRYILPYEYLDLEHSNFDYHNVNEIIIKGTGPNDAGHKVSYFKDATFYTPEPNSVKCVVYTSVMQRPVNGTEEFEDLKYGFRHLLYNTETHRFELKTKDLGNLAFEDSHQTTGYFPTNSGYMPIEAIWAGIRALELTRLMVEAEDAGDSTMAGLYRQTVYETVNAIILTTSTDEHHIDTFSDPSDVTCVNDVLIKLTQCFGTPFDIS